MPLMASGSKIIVFLKEDVMVLRGLYLEGSFLDWHRCSELSHGGSYLLILVPPRSPHIGQIFDYLAPETDHDPKLQNIPSET